MNKQVMHSLECGCVSNVSYAVGFCIPATSGPNEEEEKQHACQSWSVPLLPGGPLPTVPNPIGSKIAKSLIRI